MRIIEFDDDAEAVLVILIGIVVIGHAAIVAIGRRIIARHAPALAVHVAQIPVGYDVAIVCSAAKQRNGAVVVAILVGSLGFLEIIGPERDADFGKAKFGRGRKVGIKFRQRAFVIRGMGARGQYQTGENRSEQKLENGPCAAPLQYLDRPHIRHVSSALPEDVLHKHEA